MELTLRLAIPDTFDTVVLYNIILIFFVEVPTKHFQGV